MGTRKDRKLFGSKKCHEAELFAISEKGFLYDPRCNLWRAEMVTCTS